jgi:hypothetical protein
MELDALPPARREPMLDAIRDALDHRQLTREQLGGEVEQRVGTWATEASFPAFGGHWPRWEIALHEAGLQGIVAFGPSQGNRVTFVRLDQWVGSVKKVDGATALREVCRRFLAAYGPATHVEFARWFLTTPKAALELMQSMGDELTEVDVEGWRAWLPADDADAVASAGKEPRVHLLPQFDCYVVGSFPRQQLIPHTAPPELRKGTAAPFCVLLVDGVVGGLWARRRRGNVLAVQVGAFSSLTRAQQRQVRRQAERIAEILEATAEICFADVKPRGHL